MKRSIALKVINPVLAVLMISQIFSGLFSGALPHEAFEILHEGGGITLAVLVSLH